MKSINKILQSFTTPSDTMELPIITMISNKQITIEQHYKLISFSQSEIKLQCKNGITEIKGNKLIIKLMHPQEIILAGMIKEITFHP